MDKQSAADLCSQTQATDALIRETVSMLRNSVSGQSSSAMVFTGNWQQAYPALLVQDPVLEPVDKIVWMVIRLQAKETGTQAIFPAQDAIARKANIRSTTTVARAVAILRLTRWLSLCARVRDAGGRFRGNVYALHDEPIPLADALRFDSDYMEFLNGSTDHHHPRVQAIGRGALGSIVNDVECGRDIHVQENPMERRVRAMRALRQAEIGRYFGFNRSATAELNHASENYNHKDQHQNLTTVVCSSSNNINKKTTTTTEPHQNLVTVPQAPEKTSKLVYPKRLNANQRTLVDYYLSTIPTDLHQQVLDELEGRIRSERHGAKVVYDEARYLGSLCRKVNEERFHPNLGLAVQQERQRSRRELEKRREKYEETERSRRQPRNQSSPESVKTQLTKMRKVLGGAAITDSE